MRIFLITDIHHGRDSNYPTLGGTEYINVFGESFRSLFESLRPEVETGDLVVNLGDLIHDIDPETDLQTYQEAVSILQTKTLTKHVVGNHDVRNLSREQWCQLAGVQQTYYSFDLGGYHHVVLDGAQREMRGPFYLDEAQLEWLEQDLAQTELKTLVYCHFPLDNQNFDDNYYFKDHPERGSASNKRFVRKIFEKSGKVLAVFSGHTHFFSDQIMEGIRYVTVPSFTENDSNHRPKAEYAIVEASDDKTQVTIKKASFS